MIKEEVTRIQEALDADIPRSVIKSRSNSGKSLSYLEGHYVIDRLNQVFGNANWSYEFVQGYPKYLGTDKANGKFQVHYATAIRLTVPRVAEKVDQSYYGDTTIEDIGYGNGINGQSEFAAHELAMKESTTDALKRAAKSLGQSMGLALYDKTQANVSEDIDEKPATNSRPALVNNAGTDSPIASLLATISDVSDRVVRAGVDVADLKAYMKAEFNADRKEQLNEVQAKAMIEYLKRMEKSSAA